MTGRGIWPSGVAVTFPPFGSIFAHQVNNTVPDPKQQLVQGDSLAYRHFLFLRETSRSVQGIICSFQASLQIRDGHAKLSAIVAAEGGGQLGSTNGRSRCQPDGLGMVLKRLLAIQPGIDPCVQLESVLVDRGSGELFKIAFLAFGFLLRKTHLFFAEALGDFIPFGIALFVEGLPTHLLGDDVIAVRMIQIFFEKTEVFFGVAVLLLEEPLPLILIPNLRRLEIVVSHRKNPYCTAVSDAT